MTVSELFNELTNIWPLHLQEDYDNCGLIVGNPSSAITNILITLDITEPVIAEALSLNCNVILAHHPVIFRGIKSFRGETYTDRCVSSALKNDIAILAFHTNVDNSELGTSFEIAKRLELHSLSPLDIEGDKAVGCKALLSSPLSSDAFASYVKSKLNLNVIKLAGADRAVNSVGIVAGSGADYYSLAKKKNCDIFISADFKYHQYFDASDGPMIIDIGHYESEVFIKDVFFSQISALFSKKELNLHEIYRSSVNTNPVSYF